MQGQQGQNRESRDTTGSSGNQNGDIHGHSEKNKFPQISPFGVSLRICPLWSLFCPCFVLPGFVHVLSMLVVCLFLIFPAWFLLSLPCFCLLICPFFSLSVPVCPCPCWSLHVSDFPFLSLLVPVCPCLSLSVPACPCLSLSVPLCLCPPKYVLVCTCMSLYIPVRQCPSMSVLVFPSLSPLFPACQFLVPGLIMHHASCVAYHLSLTPTATNLPLLTPPLSTIGWFKI